MAQYLYKGFVRGAAYFLNSGGALLLHATG